jgi:hypothetical protein
MEPSLPAPSLDLLCAKLEDAGARLSALLHRGPNPSLPAIGHWNVGETAAHATSSASYFLAVARGETPPEGLDEVAATNAASLAADSERDPVRLAARAAASDGELRSYAAAAQGNPTVEIFRGIRAPLSTLLAVELAEVLVHGFDLARAAHLPWRIAPEEALPTLAGLAPLLPCLVDGERAAGFTASFCLHLRGGESLMLNFDGGTLRVTPPDDRPVDCHLSADPVAYLLLSYQRIPPWRAVLSGKLLPWGRRPWLAARLSALFKAP